MTAPYAPGATPQPTPNPAPGRGRRPILIAAVLLALAVVIGATVVLTLTLTGRDEGVSAKSQTAWDREQAARNALPSVESETLPDPTPTTVGPVLHAEDVKLSLKTTDKQCFGSAGCLVKVEVLATHATGVGTFKSPDTWRVTYEITGGTDGPVIGTFEITDGTYIQQEESLDTASNSTKLRVKVTDVEKVGL